MKHQSRQENTVYLALWGMLFAAPLFSLYIRSLNGSTPDFDWSEAIIVWPQFAIYLGLFLVHNFLLAPLLVFRHKRVLYASIVGAILAVFIIWQCSTRPGLHRRGPHPMEMHQHRPDNPHDEFSFRHDNDFHDDGDFQDGDFRHAPERGGDFRGPRQLPPAIIGEHDVVSVVILILMFGMNLGTKYYFKSRVDEEKLMALEKENLNQQLEYLKYQINPHFFMNTLNNIHALVDIDPEKAKDTIVELSKMMRFILYEGDKRGVPLSREFDFIRNYITLMSLRYTNKVRITVDLPAESPDRTVPPLMLISFIENAFKHGISYQHESFIDIHASIDGERLTFTCRNSKAEKPNQEKGGVGLTNVRQRLNLLFDNDYTLSIKNESDVYDVKLNIPLKC